MTALQDQNGNTSSKRIAMFIGLAYSMIIGFCGAFKWIDQDYAIELSKGFLFFSGGMGGISVAEFFKKG